VTQKAGEVDDAVGRSQSFDLVNLARQVRTANVHAAEMNGRAKEAQRRVDQFRGHTVFGPGPKTQEIRAPSE
jgi:hypothetical protein